MNTDNTLTFYLNKDQTFEMVFVEGTDKNGFMMGDKQWRNTTPHPVRLSAYWIGKYLVTQGLYDAVMGTNPSYFQGEVNRPVENVSWKGIMGKSGEGRDSECFIYKLYEALNSHPSNEETLEKAAKILGKKEVKFRLPSEAQWEYSAKGGKAECQNGYEFSGSDEIHEVAWYGENSHNETKPVGLKKPNGLGLYDISGNVWEWCMDTWHDNYKGAPSDGSAWVDGQSSNRVIRGGSWFIDREDVRLTDRSYRSPTYQISGLGFRICLA